MELYFTRHGKTEWNQELRFQGRGGDSPLLPSSYQEIERLGQRLSSIPFKRIYCSPQKRAKDTALGILAHLEKPCEIYYTSDLCEIGMGQLEGMKIIEARKKYSQNLDALRYHPEQYDPSPFGGEDYAAMLVRSQRVVLEAVADEMAGPILFVSHGATLTGCIQTLAGKPISDTRLMGGLHNNTISILKVPATKKRPFTLITWDDASHLN